MHQDQLRVLKLNFAAIGAQRQSLPWSVQQAFYSPHFLLKLTDRCAFDRPLLQVFEAVDMLAASVPAAANNESDANEDVYSFTKRLCQLLSIIGTRQLGPLWGQCENPP